jgi:hypothetical protein
MAEIEDRIRECMTQIQRCRSYVGSVRANQMVNSLMKVENLVKNVDSESIGTALRIVNELHRELATSLYSGYVRKATDNLKFIEEQMRKARQ